MTALNIVREPNQTIESFRDNIQDIERHLDGDDVTLVETVEIGNGIRWCLPYSDRAATAALIRELRRYADYLERGEW